MIRTFRASTHATFQAISAAKQPDATDTTWKPAAIDTATRLQWICEHVEVEAWKRREAAMKTHASEVRPNRHERRRLASIARRKAKR